MRRNTAITKSPNGFGGAIGADGELARFPALSPKIDNTTVTIAVNGVTTAWDTGATDKAAGVTADLAVDVNGETADEAIEATMFVAVDEARSDTTAEDTEDSAAFNSGLLDCVAADDGVPAVFTGIDVDLVSAEGPAVAAGVIEAGGVADAVPSAAAVPLPAALTVPVAGGVGAVVVGPTGSDVTGVAAGGAADACLSEPAAADADDEVESVVEMPAEVAEDVEVVLVDPEVPDVVVDEDGEVDGVLVVELPEVVDDGEVDLIAELPEVVDEVVDDDVPLAAPTPADVSCLWLSTLELLDDEEDPDVASVSA